MTTSPIARTTAASHLDQWVRQAPSGDPASGWIEAASGRRDRVSTSVRSTRRRGSGRKPTTRRRLTVSGALLGLFAELLIVSGLVTGLYVFWQSFYTDYEGVKAQNKIVEQLDLPEAPNGAAIKHTEAPPVIAQPDATATVFGTMMVPKWGSDYDRPIGEGTGREEVLNTIGLGHYPGTAMPGGIGNFAVAGHRVTYGKPLNRVAELVPGDSVVVRATDKKGIDVFYVYEVTDHQIVTPDHVETIAPVPNQPDKAADGRYLTLTACHPMWSARERYVVHAKLKYWMNASDGTPSELKQGGNS